MQIRVLDRFDRPHGQYNSTEGPPRVGDGIVIPPSDGYTKASVDEVVWDYSDSTVVVTLFVSGIPGPH